MAKVYERTGDIDFNMTPMIDCVFQLLIFFLLTTQAQNTKYVQMELARPFDSQAVEQEVSEGIRRIVINVAPYTRAQLAQDPTREGAARAYFVEGEEFAPEEMNQMADHLRMIQAKAGDKQIIAQLRADQRIEYYQVEPALQALQAIGVEKMDISALIEERG